MNLRLKSLGLLGALTLFGVANAQIADKIERGGDFSIRIVDGNYTLSGALTGSGSFGSSAYRFPLLLNEGLDWQLRVRDLINAIGSDYMLRFQTTILPNGDIQWDMDATPNECTTIRLSNQDYPFLLTRIWARFTLRPTAIACQADPHDRLGRAVSVQLDSVGGDAGNYLRLEGYFLTCEMNAPFFTQGVVQNLVIRAYGGGLPKALGNVNNDCIVDDADLLQVLFDFGDNAPSSDTNDDGIVGDADLLTILFNFGLEG